MCAFAAHPSRGSEVSEGHGLTALNPERTTINLTIIVIFHTHGASSCVQQESRQLRSLRAPAYRAHQSVPLPTFPFPTLTPLWTNKLSVGFTSFVSHKMTSGPHSNSQLIIDALGDYANLTGVDLSNNPFAEKLQRWNTPDSILKLLQEREKAFKEYRDGNRSLINSINPAICVLHAFSNFLGEAASLVSYIFTSPLALKFLSQSFNVILLGPLPTGKGCLCRHRCSPSRMSLHTIGYHPTYDHSRQQVVSVQAMMLFLNSLNAWEVSSNASKFIRTFRQPQ